MDSQDIYESVGTSQEAENEKYDENREREMDTETDTEEGADLKNEIWAETIKTEIEQLEFAIESDEHTIEQAAKRIAKNKIAVVHQKDLLSNQNTF